MIQERKPINRSTPFFGLGSHAKNTLWLGLYHHHSNLSRVLNTLIHIQKERQHPISNRENRRKVKGGCATSLLHRRRGRREVDHQQQPVVCPLHRRRCPRRRAAAGGGLPFTSSRRQQGVWRNSLSSSFSRMDGRRSRGGQDLPDQTADVRGTRRRRGRPGASAVALDDSRKARVCAWKPAINTAQPR